MIPYAKHHVTPEDEAAVLEVLRSPYLTQGPKVEQFEAALAEKAGAQYCVCVSSGTMALLLSYMTARMIHGTKKALVPAITFVATAHAARLAGLEVELVDCPGNAGLAVFPEEPTNGEVVHVPVTLGGRQHSVTTWSIKDACHGPIWHVDAWLTCLSFHPCKHVACGEGGAILTNDPGAVDVLRQLRNHGRSPNGWVLGVNGRMPEMSAALGLSQLQRYDENVARRRQIAKYYDEQTRYVYRAAWASTNHYDVWHLYQLLVENRDVVAARLRDAGIGTAVHYPVVPGYPASGRLTAARLFAAETLSIPLYPTLTDAEVEYVATTVKRVVEETRV